VLLLRFLRLPLQLLQQVWEQLLAVGAAVAVGCAGLVKSAKCFRATLAP